MAMSFTSVDHPMIVFSETETRVNPVVLELLVFPEAKVNQFCFIATSNMFLFNVVGIGGL